MAIPEQDLSALKSAVPLWRVAQDRLPDLKKRGAEFWAKCPFHSETTASFSVLQKKGDWIYYCHGCSATGNVFQFIEKIDSISFTEAVEKVKSLANWQKGKTNVETTFQPCVSKDEPKVVISLEKIKPAEHALVDSSDAKKWLDSRGLSVATAQKFHLGFVQSAKAVNAFHPWVDKGWIIFPTVELGQIVSLKYRSVVGKKTPDGVPGFIRKSGMATTIFNLDAVQPFDDVFVTEGEPDCMVLSQAGYTAVALPGASFTPTPEMRDKIIQAKTIFLAGDGDNAGQEAMTKLWTEFRERTYLIKWPDNCKDANETFLKVCSGDVTKFRDLVEDLKSKAKEQPMPFVYDMKETMRTNNYIKPFDNPTRLHFPWPNIDTRVAVLPGDVMYISASDTKAGKALTADTKIPTPCGAMMPIGSLRPGDWVFGSDGKPTQVWGVFPQGKRPIWRITFSDDSTINCDKDHLWAVTNSFRFYRANLGPVKGPDKVLTTEQIFKTPIFTGERPRYNIPMCGPIEFEPKHLPLHPYVLGVLIGDGGLTNTGCNLTSADDGIISKLRKYLPSDCEVGKTKSSKYGFRIRRVKDGRGRNNSVVLALRHLSLYGKRSEHKFIPEMYKFSSIQDRIDLLRGLCDTDGSCGLRGLVEYSSSSERLANDVLFLVNSLGGRASLTPKKTPRLVSHRMVLSLPPTINPFYLERKAKRFKRHRIPRRAIVKIELLTEEKEMVCITVNAKDGLFVASESFIVTHNSTWLMGVLIDNAVVHSKVVVNYSAELLPQQYAQRAVSYLTRKDREQLTQPDFLNAADLMGEARFYNGYKPGANWKEVIELLKWAKRRIGADILVVDPISFLIRGEKIFQEQGEAMRAFKDLALEYKVIVIIVGQPRKSGNNQRGREAFGQDISGSYTQSTDASQVFMLHRDRLPGGSEDQPIFDPVTKVKLEYGRDSESFSTKLYFNGKICRFFPHTDEVSQ